MSGFLAVNLLMKYRMAKFTMRRQMLLLLLSAAPLFAADLCNSKDFLGPYGFLLAGETGIGGRLQPTASLGRIVLDGAGALSGYSSVNFNGYFLGNPVTGMYEIHSDCSVNWALQDDSGAFQHFTGHANPDGSAIDFHQSDPHTEGVTGKLEKIPGECSDASFRGRFTWSLSGSTTPFAGEGARPAGGNGVAQVDGAGGLVLSEGAEPIEGTYEIGGDCFVDITYGDKKLRGILVDGGRALPVIETDPKATAAGRFTVE